MPNTDWSKLNSLQLGRYAEYYAKMEFASYGKEVYTSEVDDHGVDFVTKSKDGTSFYEIQVKSLRGTGYIFITKAKMDLTANRFVCVLLFNDGHIPDVYLVPSTVWLAPDEVFVDRNYDKAGQKSAPEWGINISKKNMASLEKYRIEKILQNLK